MQDAGEPGGTRRTPPRTTHLHVAVAILAATLGELQPLRDLDGRGDGSGRRVGRHVEVRREERPLSRGDAGVPFVSGSGIRMASHADIQYTVAGARARSPETEAETASAKSWRSCLVGLTILDRAFRSQVIVFSSSKTIGSRLSGPESPGEIGPVRYPSVVCNY